MRIKSHKLMFLNYHLNGNVKNKKDEPNQMFSCFGIIMFLSKQDDGITQSDCSLNALPPRMKIEIESWPVE